MEKTAKRGCATELTRVYSTPIGPLKLVANAEGICAVKWLLKQQSSSTGDGSEVFGSGKDGENKPHPQDSAPLETTPEVSPEERKALGHLEVCINWLDAYFDGSLLKFNPPKPPLVFPTEGNIMLERVEFWCSKQRTAVNWLEGHL